MDILLLRVFPLTLLLGGLILGLMEVRYYWREGTDRARLVRRSSGACLLGVLAVMVYTGQLPDQDHMESAVLWGHFRHWLWVMAIALLLMLLAALDALAGVRHLRRYFEDVEKEEIRKIQQHLGVAAEGSHPSGKPFES